MLHAPLPAPDGRRSAAAAGVAPGRDDATPQEEQAAAALRAEGLAATAPWFAGLSAACAIATALAQIGHIALPLLGGWAALIVAVNWVTVRARRRAAEPMAGRIARAANWTLLEVGVHALVWGALPALAMAHVPPAARLLMAGAVVTLMSGAVLLAMAPVAATLWVTMLGVALAIGAHAAGVALAPAALLLVPAWLGAILVGCLTIERLVSSHIAQTAELRTRCVALTALLEDYETRGAGWLWQTDGAHRLTHASRFLSDLRGVTMRQLTGQSLPVVLGCDAALGAAMATREPFGPVELSVVAGTEARWLSLSGTPVIARDGSFEGYRGIGADVTEMHCAQQRLTDLASMDALTGLANRTRAHDAFAAPILAAAGGDRPCAVLSLDLDRFKAVNDMFGHLAGDEVLRTVARRLRQAIGPDALIGRVGADEFALLITDASSRPALERLAATIVARIAEPIALGKREACIGISIGAAIAPGDGRTVEELMHRAGLALDDVKAHAGGAFRFFEAHMLSEAEDRMQLEQELGRAIRSGGLSLVYQPIVCASTQAVLGFEALCRWRHPERGMIPPAVFVPIAEQSGLIAELGEWVLQTACRDATAWPETMQLAVNLSGRQLVVAALVDSVSRALAASRLAVNRLELEVTEGIFISDAEGSLDVLRRIRALGVRIGLDDFGTGYSSLGYLGKAVFHTLKVDPAFVREAATNDGAGAIIRAIVQLANSFRMSITAEGVETPEDVERMRALGCHRLQGYLFGRPMPHADTLSLVGARWERKSA